MRAKTTFVYSGTSHEEFELTANSLWAHIATHTVSLLWPICEIIPMSPPCSGTYYCGSSELTVSWSPVSSLCWLIVISQWCLMVRYSDELSVSMVLAHTFTGMDTYSLGIFSWVSWWNLKDQYTLYKSKFSRNVSKKKIEQRYMELIFF